MIYEGFSQDDTEQNGENLTYKLLLFQAIATSIDAFAVGVGFCAMDVSPLPAVSMIAVITGACSMLALLLEDLSAAFSETKAKSLAAAFCC